MGAQGLIASSERRTASSPGDRRPDSRRTDPRSTRPCRTEQDARHDRGVEGGVRWSPQRTVLRIPPQQEISSRYAWIYRLQPACFKWAAMAAIASHHVRLALFPLRLDTDRTGYLDITRSLGRRKMLLTGDVNTIRATNNAIFDDIFWVHLAYVTAEDGIERLRALLRAERHYAPILSGFEAIDHGRRVLDEATVSPEARRAAEDLIWAGNLQLLEHEQRALVQPNFDLLSCAFARLVSIGSATSFEVRGVRRGVAYFTSFYVHSITRGIPDAVRAQAWPRITRFDDRWRWLVTSVVPRFRRFDADTRLVDASLQRILDDARAFASTPCIHHHVHAPTESPRRTPRNGVSRHLPESLAPRRNRRLVRRRPADDAAARATRTLPQGDEG
jgi:hypothetical protein